MALDWTKNLTQPPPTTAWDPFGGKTQPWDPFGSAEKQSMTGPASPYNTGVPGPNVDPETGMLLRTENEMADTPPASPPASSGFDLGGALGTFWKDFTGGNDASAPPVNNPLDRLGQIVSRPGLSLRELALMPAQMLQRGPLGTLAGVNPDQNAVDAMPEGPEKDAAQQRLDEQRFLNAAVGIEGFAPREPTAEATGRLALPAPSGPLALSHGEAIPMEGAIAEPSASGTFAPAYGPGVEGSAPRVFTLADLRPRAAMPDFAMSAPEAPLEGRFTELPPEPVAPVRTAPLTLDEQRAQWSAASARARANPTPPEQLAQRFPTSASDLAAQREAGTDYYDRPAPTPAADLGDQLAASLRAKGIDPETLKPAAVEPYRTMPSAYVSADPELLVKHGANDAFVDAYRTALPEIQKGEAGPATESLRTALQHALDVGSKPETLLQRVRDAGFAAPSLSDVAVRSRAETTPVTTPRRITLADLQGAVDRASATLNARGTAPKAMSFAEQIAARQQPRQNLPRVSGGADYLTRQDLERIRAERAGAQLPPSQNAAARFAASTEDAGRIAVEKFKAMRREMGAPGTPQREAYLNNVPGETPTYARPAPGRGAPPPPAAAGMPPMGPARGRLSVGPNVIPNGIGPRRFTLKDLGLRTEQASRALKNVEIAASPLHFLTRHANPFMLTHPSAWLRGAREGVTTLGRDTPAAQARLAAMRDDLQARGFKPEALSSLHSGVITGEELASGAKIRALGPLGEILTRTGDGFTMGLNRVRYEAIKGTDLRIPGVRPATAADKAAISDTVRIFSGKGFQLGENAADWQKALARVAAVPLFTPQFLAARVRMLGETALGLGEIGKGLANAAIGRGEPISPVAIERVRLGMGHLASLGAWYALMNSIGFKVDTNVDSGNFLRADLGPRNVFTGALAAFAGHVGMGTVDESDGHVHLDIGGPEAPMIRAIMHTIRNFQTGARDIGGQPKGVGPMWSFLGNQLGPGFYQVNQLLKGGLTDFSSIVLPMWVSGGAQSAGWDPPTVQPGAARPFKGDRPADLILGPTPAPTPRQISPTRTPAPRVPTPTPFFRGARATARP